MGNLRKITTVAQYKTEPEDVRQILFAFGMHVERIRARTRELIFLVFFLLVMLGVNNYLLALESTPTWFKTASEILFYMYMFGVGGKTVIHAVDIFKQAKGVRWIASELRIDVRYFRLEKLT